VRHGRAQLAVKGVGEAEHGRQQQTGTAPATAGAALIIPPGARRRTRATKTTLAQRS
jgi:hypothetical protein